MSSNEKITMRQLQILIILGAMGTGVIVLPQRATEIVPVQYGWLVAATLAIIAVAVGLLICAAVRAMQDVCEKQDLGGLRPPNPPQVDTVPLTPNMETAKGAVSGGSSWEARGDFSKSSSEKSFFETAGILLTRPVAYAICAALWLKIVLSAGLELRIFLKISRDVMLPNTPMWAVGGVMLLACAYAAAKGIETRARVAEVLFFVLVLPVLFLFGAALFDVPVDVFRNGARIQAHTPSTLAPGVHSAIGAGVLRLGFVFAGLECLLLVAPFVPREKNLGRAVAGALGLSGLIIVAITAITIASLGSGTETEAWPVIRLMEAISLSGAFVERQEALMFGFWIITAFVLGNAMLFFGGLLARDISRRKRVSLRVGVIITALAVFAVSLLPVSREEIFKILDYMYTTSGVFFLAVLPLALLIAAKITTLGQHKAFAKAAAKTAAFVIFLAFAAFLLVGCWDRVEIEQRAFVVAVGVDAADGEYTVTLSVPVFSDDDESENAESAHIKTARAHTVADALQTLRKLDERELYFGQTHLVIFANTVLDDDEILLPAITDLDATLQATRRIHVFSAENAAKILRENPPEKILPYREKSELSFYDFAVSRL